MRSFRLGIQGIAALLMNRYSVSVKGRLGPEEAAEAVACRLPDGQLYLPAEALHRAALGGAEWFGRERVTAEAVILPVVALPFTPRLDRFQVDARPVVIPDTGRRVMRYRPRLDEWAIETRLDVDDHILDPDLCRRILEVAGQREGVGDYRPGRGGPYGRFVVTKWEEVAAPAREHAVS